MLAYINLLLSVLCAFMRSAFMRSALSLSAFSEVWNFDAIIREGEKIWRTLDRFYLCNINTYSWCSCIILCNFVRS